jgi:hypothetical protein
LLSGKVLVAGGLDSGHQAELYDPATNTFALTGALSMRTYLATATLLPSGKVAFAGGPQFNGQAVEAYDPTAGTFSIIGAARDELTFGHTATLLALGQVLLAGGHAGIAAVSRAEVFDPLTGVGVPTANTMLSSRESHTATRLDSGAVVVVGGYAERAPLPAGALTAVDVFDPKTSRFSGSVSLKTARGYHTATLLPNDHVLVTGGKNGDGELASAELLTIVANGRACVADDDCASGLCVDGVCCASSCLGQCEACDVPGALGTCTTIAGAPHSSHRACDGTGTPCLGACDGTSAAACIYPAAEVACGTACVGNQENQRRCDGAGQCSGGLRSCPGNLLCGASSCQTSCSTDADCVTGYDCGADGKCGVPTCVDDATSRSSRGVVSSCLPFKCDTSGACKLVCSSVDDCIAPAVCNEDGRCIAFVDPSDRGCATGRRAPADAWWLLVVAGVAVRAMRRTRRRR